MAKKKESETALNFEAAITELESLVATLEAGEVSLEDSLQAFEKGVKLTRECQKHLSDAEQRVTLLMEENGELELVDIEDDE